MKTLILILASLTLVACGTEEDPPAAAPLPLCCVGFTAQTPAASVLMCKVLSDGELSGYEIDRSKADMVKTMSEMKYEKCN